MLEFLAKFYLAWKYREKKLTHAYFENYVWGGECAPWCPACKANKALAAVDATEGGDG